MRKAVKMIVQGTVQGVFFRQFVKDHADKLGIRGYIRNLTSGDVEIVAEGEGESIERFQRFVAKGPEHSHIRNLQVEEKKWSGEFEGFKVLRF